MLYLRELFNIFAEKNKIKTRINRRVNRKLCITLAMREKGWTLREAKRHLRATMKRTGMNYLDYRRYYFFNIPDEEQVQRYKEICETRANRKNRDTNKKDRFLKVISDETGWSKSEIRAKIADAKERTGATYKDYYAFKFWEISDEEQGTYFTQKMSNAISSKYDTNPFFRDILLNKELSCYHFDKFFRRGWCINKTVSLDEFKEIFKEDKKVVYKPLDGNGGIGIKILNVEEKGLDAIYEELRALQRGVVESFVVQHKDMASLAPGSVNTIRIVTIGNEENADIAYVSVRVGSGKSIVDNFTEGGMVAGADLETGTIVTPGVTVDGIVFEEHPETGVKFRGFKIPYFEEAIELVEEATKTIAGYIGWDVAISENGPMLIEANVMPGNRILQMPYVCDRIGKRDVMVKFL